ncbi:ABC transporter ATP-binding protein [Nonomuraea pusilla]|uniref:Putative ABC transport system ATP-binding protein n=1 Tax=Nonomuraea pusilla TaxID=46177 RepID=A0A1H8ASY1_9ACTN|nr:ABC transporter ATP-binding protein [Nonomuraea pusilla]SEM72908.1 putative ABC transport system ATP-binding protein [Nonomuraea pusilla]
MTVVSLRDITRDHGSVRALRGVSLDVSKGELVAVMGPSGSGKSTLLNIAGGLDRPTSGTVTVGGADLAGVKDLAALRRTKVGYVFQDLNLIPSLTAAENVMLPRELDGVRTGRAREEALAALASVGADQAADRFPDELSGGQRQRVAIARALVGERSLLLADEPTGALDTVTGDEILRVLRARCDDGAAVLLVTHEPRYAAWADRVVYLRDGLVAEASEVRMESAR